MTARLAIAAAAIAVIFVSIAASEPRTGPTRIAYISATRIAALAIPAQASNKKLQQLRDEKARAIADKQKQVEALRLQLARSGGMFQASKREQLRQDEARAIAELQKLQADAQSEFQKMQHQVQTELQGQLSVILASLAKQRGTEIVLNQDGGVVWAVPGMDWTNEVIQRLNEQSK